MDGFSPRCDAHLPELPDCTGAANPECRQLPRLSESRLDPNDWSRFRRDAHHALDMMVDHLEAACGGPVWREPPAGVRERFTQPLPRTGRPLADILRDFDANIRPYATGNTHPMFMGWVHGAGTPVGMVAEMLAAGLNANCGGRNHIAIDVERQIARWSAEFLGYPQDASGIFVTGTSMANFLGLLVARNRALGADARKQGLVDIATRLTAYCSVEAHACIAQAMETSGTGSANLRLVPTDRQGRIRIDALSETIARDRRGGFLPFLIVGTAGSVNTGAIDDLDGLADMAAAQGAWFHVDGAFGALAALSPELRPLLAGIDRSDSIAFDFHKWAHVPYDAGFLLVRDGAMHRATFSNPADYLGRAPEGLAAGDVWPCDLGMDLSRGFRALKTWFTIESFGADQLGLAISESCGVARHLGERIDSLEQFETVAPVHLNIVCFRPCWSNDDDLSTRIAAAMQSRGVAAPSTTRIDGRAALRCAIVNHRTTACHVDRFCAALTDLAAELMSP